MIPTVNSCDTIDHTIDGLTAMPQEFPRCPTAISNRSLELHKAEAMTPGSGGGQDELKGGCGAAHLSV